METKEYKRRFIEFYNALLETHLFFYVWKSIRNNGNEKVFSNDIVFWKAVIPGLEFAWSSNLSRIFEFSEHSKRDEVISFFSLINLHPNQTRAKEALVMINNHNALIENLTKYRNNWLSHYNNKGRRGVGDLLKRYPIRFDQVKELLELSGKLLKLLNPDDGNSYVLEFMNKDCEKGTENILKKIKHTNKLIEKNNKRFVRGEIDNQSFPFEE